jgi:hypothetical protein
MDMLGDPAQREVLPLGAVAVVKPPAVTQSRAAGHLVL